MMSEASNRLYRLDLLLIVATITAACLPFLLSGTAISLNDDWLQLASRHALLRRSLLHDPQLPLRTPFYLGGYPSIADPEDPTLNPLAILTLCFGEVMGLKLIAFTMYLAAGLGTYYLTRRCMGCGRTAALFASLTFGLCGWTPARHAGGNVNEMYFTLTPLILGLLLESRERKSRVVVLALLQAVILTDGKLVWPSTALFLVLFCVLEGARVTKREAAFDPELLRNFSASAALALLLAGAKILPVLGLYRVTPAGLSLNLTYHAKAYSPDSIGSYDFHELVCGLLTPFSTPLEVSSSRLLVGPVPLLAFALGSVFCFRFAAPWLFILVLWVWLLFTYNAPVDLFRLLHALPVFSSMTSAFKYFDLFILLAICLVGARFLDWLGPRVSPMAFRLIAVLLILGSALPLLWTEFWFHGILFRHDRPVVSESASFYQVRGIRLKVNAARTPLSNMYLNALRNVGTVDAFVPLHIPIAAEPRLFIDEHDTATPNSRYQGETYFLTTAANRVEIKRFTANSITLAVSALAPDTLVVNQNWHRAWRTNRGVVVSHDGLLAVALEESGNYEVRLRYKPAGFYAGLAISLLALASVVALHSGLRPQTASPNLLTTWVAWPVAVEVPKWRFSLGSLSSPVRAAWAVGALWLLTALFSLFWQSAVSPMLTSDALLYNARKLAEAGQADEAIALLQRAALLRPKHPVVHHALGKLYNAKGAHLAAIGELRTALELDPEDYFSHRQLARAYGSLGWYVEAIAQAERARAIEPFEPAIFVDLAQFRAGAGQLDRALRDLERAAELGYDDLAELESLALLAPLRQSDRYRRVAETVHGRR